MKFTSTLVQIKEIEKGSKVGYSKTYIAPKRMKIGIIPAGYYDGIDRRLSNKGLVKINKTYCPIIGRVSMNITTIDLSKAKNAKVGNEVIVYSDNPKDQNSIESVSLTTKTIPYEILTKISETIKREII